jgi:CheY-like chemotaxis protein/HPt (histidine-containing phosphotransfer) domain-containing protein
LVEDNPINQELAYELLTSAGLEITVANNGREALEWLDKKSFTCILMDVQMPVLDGLQATRLIREQDRFDALPVIAMTAGAMTEERQQTIDAGMDDHITKPIDIDQMFATIAHWIKYGRARGPSEKEPLENGEAKIPSLDITFGLKSVGNKAAFHRKLLRTYLDASETTMRNFDNALIAGDMPTLRRLAHTLKGSSGSLGMHRVYQTSGVLEKSEPSSTPEKMAELLAVLKSEQADALEAIRIHLATPE